jgi:hypothetical protein
MSRVSMSRGLGLAGVLGGVLWIVSWLGNAGTDEGNKDYAGLVEGDWRALLNLALLASGAAVWGVHRRFGPELGRFASIAATAALVGLAIALVGNVLEFGLDGGEIWLDEGWAFVLIGGAIATAALVVLGVLGARRLDGAPQWLLALAAGSFSAIPLWGITFGLGFVLLGAALAWPARETISLREETA